MNTMVEYAKTYASRGWRVLPLRGKIPLVDHGVKSASCAAGQILTWWTSKPQADVGIATGRQSGLVVLDVDPRHGGDETLLELQAAHGKLPQTLEVLTGGGGRHLYFKYPAGVQYVKCSAGKLGPGLDVRADGGYVVAPPSVHPDTGKPYEWEVSSDPLTGEPAELPDWLLHLLTVSRTQASNNGHKPSPGSAIACPQADKRAPGAIPQGQRNTTLTSVAGKLRRAGLDELAILAALQAVNQVQCHPPLAEAEVASIAASVCRYQTGFALTDGGNAEFFADRCANQVCYRHDLRRFFVWRSPVWKPDNDGEIDRLALEAVRERQAQAMNIQDSDQRKKAMQFLLQSENGYRLRSMIEIAKSLKPLAKSGAEFDQKNMLLAVQNGVIDLTTGEFREGRPGDYLTQCAGTYYDPNAKADRWEQFLSEVFQGDSDLAAFVQRLVGYTVTGWTHEQVFVFCYGTGRNGKSTLFEILRNLLGDYSRNTAFTTFTRERGNNGHEDDLMSLEGARLVTALESKTISQLAEDTLKTIAGSDPITGSRKHERTRTYIPTFKVWLAANNLPKVKDVTEGFWRKVILLPFTVRFDGVREDKQLSQKLRTELPGILNWALAGCLAYQREGLTPPGKCVDAVTAWRGDNDPLADFLENCKIGAEYEAQVSALYQQYERFCAANNQKPISMTAFSPLVEAHGFKRERRRNIKVFLGIGL